MCGLHLVSSRSLAAIRLENTELEGLWVPLKLEGLDRPRLVVVCAAIAQVGGKGTLLIVGVVVLLLVPEIGEGDILALAARAVGELDGGHLGQGKVDKLLGLVPGLVLLDALALALDVEDVKLLASGPVRLDLEGIRLLDAGHEEDVLGVVLGAVEAVAGVDEGAEALKGEPLGQVVGDELVGDGHGRAVHLLQRGFKGLELLEEGVLVEAEGVELGAFPEGAEDGVPALDKGVAGTGGDEVVVEGVVLVTALDAEAGHLVRRLWVRKLVPANVVEVSQKDGAGVHPDTAVLVEKREADEISRVLANKGAVHGTLVEGLGQPLVLEEVCHARLRVGHVVEHVDGPLRPETAHPVDDGTLVPRLHGLPAAVPERPDILLRGDGVAVLQPLRNLLVGASVNLGGGDGHQARGQLLLDLPEDRGGRSSRGNVDSRGCHVCFYGM